MMNHKFLSDAIDTLTEEVAGIVVTVGGTAPSEQRNILLSSMKIASARLRVLADILTQVRLGYTAQIRDEVDEYSTEDSTVSV